MMKRSEQELRTERRSDYVVFLPVSICLTDADAQGRLGEALVHSCFGDVIRKYLAEACSMDMRDGAVGLSAVETLCRFHRGFRFPDNIDAGLRIGQLGDVSARFEAGLFRRDEDKPVATGYFTYVFVTRDADRPTTIPDNIRAGLVKLTKRI